jgi:hypothetical protein
MSITLVNYKWKLGVSWNPPPHLDLGVGPATQGKATMSTRYNSPACERELPATQAQCGVPNGYMHHWYHLVVELHFKCEFSCCVELTNDVSVDMLPRACQGGNLQATIICDNLPIPSQPPFFIQMQCPPPTTCRTPLATSRVTIVRRGLGTYLYVEKSIF